MKLSVVTVDLLQLRLCQGSAETGDDVFKAELMGGDYVHIAFDNHDAVGLGGWLCWPGPAHRRRVICERGRFRLYSDIWDAHRPAHAHQSR